MKNFLYIWIFSTVIYYFTGLFIYFAFTAYTFSHMSAVEVLILLVCIASFTVSAAAYHPQNAGYRAINKTLFLLELLGRYAFFVCIIFALLFNLHFLFYIAGGVILVFDYIVKIIIISKVKKTGHANFLMPDINIQLSLIKSYLDKTFRSVAQIVTIPLFLFFLKLTADGIIVTESWFVCLIGFVIMPAIWGIGEFVDYIIIKRRRGKRQATNDK